MARSRSRSRLLVLAGAVGLMAVVAALSALAAPQRFRGRPVPVKLREGDVPKFDGSPPKHAGEYPAFNLVWQADARVRDAQGVFPHPLLSGRVILATGGGLTISEDAGRTWKELPGTGPGAIGAVRHIEFALDRPDAFYISSATRGVWRVEAGKPPAQIGSKATGLISDVVWQVGVDGGDPLFRTLAAVHGPDAAGLSRSEDGGRTWNAVPSLRDYYVEKLIPGGPGVAWCLLLARPKDPSNPRGVYFCRTLLDYPKDYASDADAVDGALELLSESPNGELSDMSYWATSGGGLLKIERGGTNADRFGPGAAVDGGKAPADGGDADKWASIGVTSGATADERIIYAFNPAKLGLMASADGGKTFQAFGRGLPGGRFVKQGAEVRAAAGGGVFYAAINNALYVGRRYTGPLAITETAVSPPEVRFAPSAYAQSFNRFRSELTTFRDQRTGPTTAQAVVATYRELTQATSDITLSVTARIAKERDGEAGPTTTAAPANTDVPAQVTVDLSRVGGSVRALMYDDGLHNDGTAGDGVYGAVVLFRPDRLNNHGQDLRRPWPGAMGLTITAVSEDGKLSSAVAMLCLLNRPESHTFWSPTDRDRWKDLDGGLTCAMETYDGPALPDEIVQPSAERKSLKLTPTDKPWSIPFTNYYDRNALGYESVSFFIRTDGPPMRAGSGGDLYVQLRDSSPDTVSAATVRVPFLKDALVEGGTIDGTWRRVTVPFAKLLIAPPAGAADASDALAFRPTLLHSVVLCGDGRPAGADKQNIWIGQIRFYVPDAKASQRPRGGQ